METSQIVQFQFNEKSNTIGRAVMGEAEDLTPQIKK